jgi:Reverse transcriptase (RNA-dependent DNA polymerase)
MKSSPRDILPTTLLKQCAAVFTPIIAHLANISFEDGVFPSVFKVALVLPLLKKPSLDSSELANYRPISKLNTISKVIERLVLARLRPHLMKSENFSSFQSAYRAGHSTETALLCVLHSVYEAKDNKQLTVLVGLDISATFDTVNHQILLKRLNQVFGVSDRFLD